MGWDEMEWDGGMDGDDGVIERKKEGWKEREKVR